MTGLFASLAQDVRHSFRSHRNAPVFTLAALLSLALGIGANTAIFSLLNAVLLKTLPVRQPESLVQLSDTRGNTSWTNLIWEYIRDHLESQVNDSLVQERLMAVLSALFGVLALAVAAVGLTGLVSYSVSRRRAGLPASIPWSASARSRLSPQSGSPRIHLGWPFPPRRAGPQGLSACP